MVSPGMSPDDLIEALLADDVGRVTRWMNDGLLSLEAKDKSGRDLLHQAVSAGASRLVGALIAFGIDPRAKNKYGEGALSDAVRAGRVDLIETLVRAGADLNETDAKGNTPLHHAILNDSERTGPMIRELLRLGADKTIRRKTELSAEELAQGIDNRDYARFFE